MASVSGSNSLMDSVAGHSVPGSGGDWTSREDSPASDAESSPPDASDSNTSLSGRVTASDSRQQTDCFTISDSTSPSSSSEESSSPESRTSDDTDNIDMTVQNTKNNRES